jgi:hypothetical protein
MNYPLGMLDKHSLARFLDLERASILHHAFPGVTITS